MLEAGLYLYFVRLVICFDPPPPPIQLNRARTCSVPRLGHASLAPLLKSFDLDLDSGRVWCSAVAASVDRKKSHYALHLAEERSPVIAGSCVFGFDLCCKVDGGIVQVEERGRYVETG